MYKRQVLPDLLGVRIGAPIPHYLASGTDIDGPTELTPELTDQGMRITLAWESDYRQTLKQLLPGANRLDGRKVIYVDANLWMLAPNTILDIDSSGNFVTSPDEWVALLDEKAKLDYIMAGAIGRFTLARQRLTSKQQGFVDRSQWLGDIIRVINDGTDADQIRGPLTSINWNFNPHHHTTLKTGFGKINQGDLAPIVFRTNQTKK